MDYDEAVAIVTGPGQPYEIEERVIGSSAVKVFKNAPANLAQLFEASRNFSDQTFLVYEGERWSFAETMALSDQIAASLVNKYGVVKGDRVAIAMRNQPEWVASYCAALSVGAIATLLNSWWEANELRYGIADSGAKIVIADLERAHRASEAVVELNIPLLVARAAQNALPKGAQSLSEALQGNGDFDRPEILPEDFATLLYTSGTTGNPKGALSTHRAVMTAVLANGARSAVDSLRSAKAQASEWPVSFVLGLPLFHATGSVSILLSAVALGSKIVMMHRWDPEAALAIIENEHITHFVGVPTMSWDLLESPRFSSTDISSLFRIGGGGASVPPELIRKITRQVRGGEPAFGYGMTETNTYGPRIDGEDALQRPTSAGRMLPIMEVKILGPSGEEVPTGERGEICFFGSTVISQYWNKPDETQNAFHGKWLRSGDIGHLDEDGYVYVDDRLKDVVIRGGENVYCVEVEAAIYEHPSVHEVAVFGLEDKRLGEKVAAAIYPTEGANLDPEELRLFLKGKIANFKIPAEIFVLDKQLPRGATGKIQKRELREHFA